MPYDETIPQPTDSPSESQPDILANFVEIETFLAVNHRSFNTAQFGNHNFVTFVEQATAPTIFPASMLRGFIFSQQGVYSGVTELAVKQADIQTSTTTIATPTVVFTEGLNANPGWFRFASGILVKWFSTPIPFGGSANFTGSANWPTAATIPVFSANTPYVFFTPQRNGNRANAIPILRESNSNTVNYEIRRTGSDFADAFTLNIIGIGEG